VNCPPFSGHLLSRQEERSVSDLLIIHLWSVVHRRRSVTRTRPSTFGYALLLLCVRKGTSLLYCSIQFVRYGRIAKKTGDTSESIIISHRLFRGFISKSSCDVRDLLKKCTVPRNDKPRHMLSRFVLFEMMCKKKNRTPKLIMIGVLLSERRKRAVLTVVIRAVSKSGI
jgi:hypothetical protein